MRFLPVVFALIALCVPAAASAAEGAHGPPCRIERATGLERSEVIIRMGAEKTEVIACGSATRSTVINRRPTAEGSWYCYTTYGKTRCVWIP